MTLCTQCSKEGVNDVVHTVRKGLRVYTAGQGDVYMLHDSTK